MHIGIYGNVKSIVPWPGPGHSHFILGSPSSIGDRHKQEPVCHGRLIVMTTMDSDDDDGQALAWWRDGAAHGRFIRFGGSM